MAIGLAFVAQADNWMSSVENEAYLNQLSIPGTHDSATAHGFSGFLGSLAGNSSAKTQSKTISEQWECGVRAFDLRPALTGGKLEIFHGVCQTKLSMAGALSTICTKLDQNPTEFAIILTRHETDGDSNNSGWAEAMTSLLQQEPYASHIIAYRPDLTVSQMRGKVVILSRDRFTSDKVGFVSGWSHSSDFSAQQKGTVKCGSSTGKVFAQDFYDCTGAGADQTKINAVKTMNGFASSLCKSAQKTDVWVINHTSGYTKSASSDGNRDMAAKANTALIADLAAQTVPGPTGIVMMDFAGEDVSSDYNTNGLALVNAIIARNFDYGMQKNLPADAVLTPTPSDDQYHYYHTFTAVRRGYKIAAQSGNEVVGINATGETVPDNAQWELIAREDGTVDIKNKDSEKYIGTDTDHNNTLTLTESPASTGWTFTPVGTTGLYTISSSDHVQFNQTRANQGNKVYNWYDPSHGFPDATDHGCLYRITRVGSAPAIPSSLDKITAPDGADAPIFDLTGRRVSSPSAPGIYISGGRKFLLKK